MCCGKNRAQLHGTVTNPPTRFARPVASPQPSLARTLGLTFEYTGSTRLSVTGPVTGRQYRFERRGHRVTVDPRDRPAIAAIPVLRQVR